MMGSDQEVAAYVSRPAGPRRAGFLGLLVLPRLRSL